MGLPIKQSLVYMIRLPFLFIVFLWQDIFCLFKRKRVDPSLHLDGKLIMVTGANRGIGKQIASDLYHRGADVILACRDFNVATKACCDIAKDYGSLSNQLIPLQLDLGSFSSIRAACSHLLSNYTCMDILINNAGMVGSKVKGFTVDGYEETCQVNFISPCLLTHYLMPLLSRSSSAGRVVMVTSEFNLLPISFDIDLFLPSSPAYNELINYAMSKFALNGAVLRMVNHLKDTNVTINCVHPGCVKTDLVGKKSPWIIRLTNRAIQAVRSVSIKTGAQGPIYVAIEPTLASISGQYFVCGLIFNQNKRLYDEKVQNEIWNFIEPCFLSSHLDTDHNKNQLISS